MRMHSRASSVEYGVPVELLMACTLTEAAAKNPETCVREEPGYVSDDKTPARISAGMCQLLISSARSIMKDPNIDRAWLFNPANSLDACRRLHQIQSRSPAHGLGSYLRRLRV